MNNNNNIDIRYGNIKINEYTYLCDNFNFLYKLNNLTNLNSEIKDKKTLDLSPLSKVKSIGDKFLFDYVDLKNINFSSLSEVEFIGNYFIFFNNNLTSIDSFPLSNLNSIGNYFFCFCNNLKYIN